MSTTAVPLGPFRISLKIALRWRTSMSAASQYGCGSLRRGLVKRCRRDVAGSVSQKIADGASSSCAAEGRAAGQPSRGNSSSES